jgi:hypothetical protein
MRKLKTISYFLLLLIAGCVEPFTPKTIVDAGNTLVVEGSINPIGQTAQVKLSRAVPLDADEEAETPRETQADVRVEVLGGSDHKLTEVGDGNYEITGINFDPQKKYRLKIRTSTGSTYESEYVAPIVTPPLDSVSWRTVGDVLSVEANTHDATGKAKYFIWSFEDTYEYTSPLGSLYVWHPGGTVSLREEQVFKCWLTQPSTSIIIGTTRQLKENIIKNFRVNSIARGSIKLKYKYSILVRQRAISEEEYEFWLELQKTTQNVGGLFDPMPAQVTGNLICTSDPEEPVLGFFSAGNVVEQRIFISWTDLPEYFKVVPRPIFCETDSVSMADITSEPGPLYIVGTYGMSLPEGYIVSSIDCTDCTSIHEGIDLNKKPPFWID